MKDWMKDSTFKQVYAFTNLALVTIWAAFLVFIVIRAYLVAPGLGDVVAAAGVGVLLGAYITWNTNINQHYFRKKNTEEPVEEPTEPPPAP